MGGKNSSLEPGSLRGRPTIQSATESDSDILTEVANMNADEFKKKYIKGRDAAKNMAAYLKAKEGK
jgi:hypothetical protein